MYTFHLPSPRTILASLPSIYVRVVPMRDGVLNCTSGRIESHSHTSTFLLKLRLPVMYISREMCSSSFFPPKIPYPFCGRNWMSHRAIHLRHPQYKRVCNVTAVRNRDVVRYFQNTPQYRSNFVSWDGGWVRFHHTVVRAIGTRPNVGKYYMYGRAIVCQM